MSRPVGGTHAGTHEDRGCAKAPKCLECPFPVCREEEAQRPVRTRRSKPATNPAGIAVQWVKCSCGLTETMTVFRGRPILTRIFREHHAGHTLTGIGLAEPEHIMAGSMWGMRQAHFQPDANKGRGR